MGCLGKELPRLPSSSIMGTHLNHIGGWQFGRKYYLGVDITKTETETGTVKIVSGFYFRGQGIWKFYPHIYKVICI